MFRWVAKVAPFVGAWIEITIEAEKAGNGAVAPFVGAWIEIQERLQRLNEEQRRSLCGSVD